MRILAKSCSFQPSQNCEGLFYCVNKYKVNMYDFVSEQDKLHKMLKYLLSAQYLHQYYYLGVLLALLVLDWLFT